MASLTRVTVEESHKVYTDITFTCPLEIAELYKTLREDYNRYVDIVEVKEQLPSWSYYREYGIEEPGTYMIWEEEDGTKKCYKLEDYYRDSGDCGDGLELESITLASAE